MSLFKRNQKKVEPTKPAPKVVEKKTAPPSPISTSTSALEQKVNALLRDDDVESTSSVDRLEMTDTSEWTVADVVKWLTFSGLGQHASVFKENEVTGKILTDLSMGDLIDMGIMKLFDRKGIIKAVAALKTKKPFDAKQSWESASSHSDTSDRDSGAFSFNLQENPIQVKLYHGDDIRVVDLEDFDFEKFNGKVSELFGKAMVMKYEDSEGDKITMNSKADLHRAYKTAVSQMGAEAVVKINLIPSQVLSESETKTFEAMADAVIIIDATGHIVFFNKVAASLFGYSRSEVIGKNVRVLMPAEHAKMHKKYIKNYLKTGKARIIGKGRLVNCKRADGSEFGGRLSISETKDVKASVHYFVGILHAEDAKETPVSSAPLSTMWVPLDPLLDITVVIDRKGTVQFFNKAAEKSFGYSKSEVHGKNVKMLMPEPFRSEHDVYLANYAASKIPKVIGAGRNVPIQRKDGSISPAHLKLTQCEIEGQEYFTGMISLIAEADQKPSKSVLEQEREVLNTLLLPALIIDTAGVIQAFNPPAVETFGYSLQEMIGQNVTRLMGRVEDQKAHDGHLRAYANGGKAKIIGIGRKVIAKKKDGKLVNSNLWVTEKSDNGKKFYSGIIQPVD